MEDLFDDMPINLSPHEDITACFSALSALEDFDYVMLGEDEKELIREIRQMSLKIIHAGIKEIYQLSLASSVNTRPMG
jgi:hypothetical protein